jgi:cytochrome c-type biogenesis protein CcmF
VGPPAFRPFIVPLALILVLLSGIGPLIAWRRVTLANLRRNFALPVLAGVVVCLVLLIATNAGTRPLALLMFTFGTFVIAAVFQEVARGTAARRAISGDPIPVAFVGLIQRNRRRYGGYTVHAGLAVLLIGVAGSSSFQHSRDVILAPGQSANVDGYTIKYVQPTAQATNAKLSFGAVLDVSKGGKHVTTLRTSRGFYPAPTDPTLGPISEAFNGQADSNVGLRAGLTRDIWTVINPDLTPLQPAIAQGDKVFLAAMSKIAAHPATARQFLPFISDERARAIIGLTQRFITHPWPVEFLLIVSPLVMWIWLGALIMLIGALIALWPAPRLPRRRRAEIKTAARVPPAPALSVREPV